MCPPFEAAVPSDRSGDPVTPEGGWTGPRQAEHSEDTHMRVSKNNLDKNQENHDCRSTTAATRVHNLTATVSELKSSSLKTSPEFGHT